MLNQFFALGGVTNLRDFYAKFPTEAHFDRHIKKLRNGGLIRYQGQTGSSTVIEKPVMPRREDYQTGSGAGEKYDQAMQEYNAKLAEYEKAVAAQNQNTTPANQQTSSTAATPSEPKTKLNPYGGGSLVDFLKTQDKASSKQSRQKLAQKLGITDYTGRPDQNNQILKALRENPGLLDDYENEQSNFDENTYVAPGRRTSTNTGSTSPTTGGFKSDEELTPQEYAQRYQYVLRPENNVNPFVGGGAGQQPIGQDEDGNPIWPWMVAGAGAAGAGGYGAYREYKGFMDAANQGKFNMRGVAKGKLTRAQNALRTEAFAKMSQSMAEFQKWWNKLPKEQKAILNNLDAMEIPGDIANTRPGTAMRNLQTIDMLNEAAAEDLIVKDRQIAQSLADADEEAKAIRSARAKRAAEARWKNKQATPQSKPAATPTPKPTVTPKPTSSGAPVKTAKPATPPPKAGGSWYDDALTTAGRYYDDAASAASRYGAKAVDLGLDAWRAARNSPGIARAAKLFNFFNKVRKDGGELDDLDMMHYYGRNPNYAYGGNYGYGGYHAYDNGGAYPMYQPGGEEEGGTTWGDVGWGAVKILDPTGFTSWGDAGRSISKAWDDPSWGNVGSALLETAGALPVVGKLGKLAKGVKYGIEGVQAVNKAKKAGVVKKGINKVGDAIAWVDNSKVGQFLQPIKNKVDYYNPLAHATVNVTNKLAAKSPTVGKVLQVTTPINRGTRFMAAAAPPANMVKEKLDKAAGRASGKVYDRKQDYKKEGGTYSAGVYYDDGGTFVPSYADSAYGLPKFGMGAMGVPTAMYGGYSYGGPTFSQHTGYPRQDYVPALDWMQEGGMMEQQMMEQQGAPQQQGQQIDPQQLMQMVAEMLQQGAQPDQIMQQLVQMGVPPEMAQQVIEQVMQQMRGGQEQAPEQQFQVGGEYNLSHNDIQKLIQQGYQIEYL